MATRLKTLVKSRSLAFERQEGRCFYCDYPMWRGAVERFALLHKITVKQASKLQCTAEHLTARQDGGKDTASNIAAACVTCNSSRHRRAFVPEPEAYRALVQARLSRKKWHSVGILVTA